MSVIPSGFDWRLGRVEKQLDDIDKDVRASREGVARHEEQINGDTGVLVVLHEIKEEMGNVRKALYSAAGGCVFAAIAIATSIAVYAH